MITSSEGEEEVRKVHTGRSVAKHLASAFISLAEASSKAQLLIALLCWQR